MTTVLSRMRIWLRSVRSRTRLEREMEDELRFHIASRADDLQRGGLTAKEAHRRASIEMGGIATHKDGMRASLGLSWWDDLCLDLRYALRTLRRSPGFTLVAVGSLALAIGANTSIFSLANEALYERLGVPQPRQLRLLSIHNPEHGVVRASWGNSTHLPDGTTRFNFVTYPIFRLLQRNNHVLNDLFAFKAVGRTTITIDGKPQTAQAMLVSGNFYQQLQMRPALGRSILPSDDGVESNPVLLISDGFWTRAFARDPHIIGKTVVVNTFPMTIIGVNPKGFTGTHTVQTSPDIFLPLAAISRIRGSAGPGESYLDSTRVWWVNVMARSKAGVSDTEAQAALNVSLNEAIQATMSPSKDDSMPKLFVEDGSHGVGSIENALATPMHVLMIMTGFVLLLACANLANLVLARAGARRREMGVRLALGASRGRVMRQVLTENLLLAFIGGAAGLILGYFGSTLLPSLTMNAWDTTEIHIPFNWHIFAFAAAITMATGILFGIAPAFAATRVHVGSVLHDTSQAFTRRSRGLSNRLLVGFQIALSTLLVAGAALFLHTLWALNRIDPGFEVKHLLLFDLEAPASRYPSPKEIALHQKMEQSLRSVPGVVDVTASDLPLVADFISRSDFQVEGRPKASKGQLAISTGYDYFRTMGIPILQGRAFTQQDTTTSPRVSIINQAMARQLFPGENPIGKRFRTGNDDPWTEIIGISGNVRYANMRDEPPPLHFDLYTQNRGIGTVTYAVRTAADPNSLLPALRSAMATVDHDMPLMDIRTQQQQIDASLQQEHIFASLTAGFGLLALLLACVGIYGMMAYRVAQRTQEIGLRLAMGAQRQQVRRMILSEAGWLAVGGVCAGLLAAFLLAQTVRSMLYGVGAADPLSLAGSAAVLLSVALLSAWMPASRAARMEPLDALRHE